MEELINKIENILNEDICFHSCNDKNCKFEEYWGMVNHKLTDYFYEWISEEQNNLIKKKINEILELLKGQNNIEIYTKMLNTIYYNEYDDDCYFEVEELFDFPDDVEGTDAEKQYFIDYLKRTLKL